MMEYFIDTHSHVYLPEFDNDREAVINNAIQNNVRKIILPNIDSHSIDPMNEVVLKYPNVCFPLIGLHPTSVKENYREELSIMEHELAKNKYYGIGEIGIDLYWDKTFLREQCISFSRQLDLSLQYKLPVVIHARESFNEILEILEAYRDKGLRGIFHAFTGSPEIALRVTDLGFKLGIGGILTYKKSTLPEVVLQAGIADLVLETDSPYLAPVPYRGKRNESSYIPIIAETICRLKNITLDELARITTHTANSLFALENHGRS